MSTTWFSLVLASAVVNAEPAPRTYSVGVAKIDITPAYAIRLSGFGFRRTESEGVTQRIWAKALVIDDGEPAVLLTVDNLGVPAYLVDEIASRLAKDGVRSGTRGRDRHAYAHGTHAAGRRADFVWPADSERTPGADRPLHGGIDR